MAENNVFLALFPIQLYSQQMEIEQVTFTLEEYSIKDSNFYNDLCSVLFSSSLFDPNPTGNYSSAMCYDTNAAYIDYEVREKKIGKKKKREIFSANFRIFSLMNGAEVLHVTKNGKRIIGYFCIENMTCFILDSTQQDFILQYLMPIDKRRQFTVWNIGGESGYIDVYMNIQPDWKIEVVKIYTNAKVVYSGSVPDDGKE